MGLKFSNVLEQVQVESRKWREENFPPEHRTAPLQALGLCEEAGELAHHVLKDVQGIRGSHEHHVDEIGDALGDIFIYACGLADHYGLSVDACVEHAWAQVQQRDWRTHKVTGSPVPLIGPESDLPND